MRLKWIGKRFSPRKVNGESVENYREEGKRRKIAPKMFEKAVSVVIF